MLGHSLASMGQMTNMEPRINVILGIRCYSLRVVSTNKKTIVDEDLIISIHFILATRE